MFGSKRESEQTRIKLPRRSVPPTIDYLQFAFVQAFQYVEKEVEITWSDYSNTKLFTMIVKAVREKDIPLWSVWEESAKGSEFLWSVETSELAVIEQKVLSIDPIGRDLSDNVQKTSQPNLSHTEAFSNSYHGIRAQPQNSLRQSLTRMRSAHPNSATSNNNQMISSNKSVIKNDSSTFASVQTQVSQTREIVSGREEPISERAASKIICQTILNGVANLCGDGSTIPVHAFAEDIVSGTLEQTRIENKHLIKIIANSHLSGKLELINQNSGRGWIYFDQGVACSASVVIINEQLSQAGLVNEEEGVIGDQALMETIIWSGSSFKFFLNEQPSDRNIIRELDKLIQEGWGLRDDLNLLEKAGLKELSIIVKKQDGLGDNELRLLLGKHSDADVSEQMELYKRLPKKFTVADIVEEGPLSKVIWVPTVYRFFSNGLVEIKPPLAINEAALNFMEEGKVAVQALKASFLRQETGILSYPALLYFLQYEYLRFQSYDTPLSFIVFEMSKVSTNELGGLDLINKEETLVALNRINAMKRPLDFLGHFEAVSYALLLPNTNIYTAGQMAKRLVGGLTAQPLSPYLDPSLLKLSFGIGSIPQDCGDVEELVILSKKAMQQSRNGDFLIVQAGGSR